MKKKSNNQPAIIAARYSFLLSAVLLFSACEKNLTSDEDGNNGEPNWEIVRNFDEKKSYASVKLHVYNQKFFFSTFGHHGITPGSLANLHDFLGSYYYYKDEDLMLFQTTNNAIVQMKTHQNKLYGIREYKEPYSYNSLKNYRHKYILYKWENNNFTNLDTLEKINNQEITLSFPEFWIHNNKLHLIAQVNSNIMRVFNLENERFELTNIESIVSPNIQNVADGGYASYMLVRTIPVTETLTDYEVTGHWFDGTSFKKGKTHLFHRHDNLPEYSTSYEYYVTIKDKVFGLKNGGIYNIDEDQKLVASIGENEQFNTAGYILVKGGKIILVSTDKQLNAQNLYIFDGQTLQKHPYRLPEPLDPNSKLMDFVEIDNTIYLALINRYQYVIVKKK